MDKNVVYEPTDIARQVFREKHMARIRFLVGAVRAAKSFTANDITIEELQKLPACKVLVSGYSITSVARNVIAEWKQQIAPDDNGSIFQMRKEGKDEFLQINWRGLRNKKFYIRGASKDHDWKQIQGGTFGYWYADELTRHAENFVDMALSRISESFAKAIWTTNPDNPLHWAKRRFIDDPILHTPDKFGVAEMKVWVFYIEDNPSLSMRYINGLKKYYTGMFYKRYILSQWVAAEGAVYDFYTDEDPMIITPGMCPRVMERVISIDYGTNNPTSVGMYGINRQNEGLKIWRERGFYYDGAAKEKQLGGFKLTDSELADKIEEFTEGIWYQQVIVDPSAASLKTELARRNLPARIVDADNSVLDGIRTQMTMLKSGLYAIVDTPSNHQCRLDYTAYMWDPKAKEKGIDKVIKQNDHTKDEERYVLQTLFGENLLDYTQLNKR